MDRLENDFSVKGVEIKTFYKFLIGIKKSFFFFFWFCLFATSWAAPAAYGGSPARGRIGAVATGLRQSHSNSGSKPAASATYTTAHGNTRSLTH